MTISIAARNRAPTIGADLGFSRVAPITLFVYNRPDHVRQTVEALKRNEFAEQSDLIVYCDAAKEPSSASAAAEVRDFVRSIVGFKSLRVVERDTNIGLAESIIEGVTETCRDFGRTIVLEDDLVTAPFFLRYMNEALNVYEKDRIVGSIVGYWYPVDNIVPESFFLRGARCWGWATWSRAWQMFEPDGRKLLASLRRLNLCKKFDLDGAFGNTQMLKDQIAGRNNSWAIRWHATMFLAEWLQLTPGRSLVSNIGFDGTGIHCDESEVYDTRIATSPITVTRIPLQECAEARASLIRFFRGPSRSLSARVIGRLRRIAGV
jgi:hypothetical protein